MSVSVHDSFAELPAVDWDTLTVGANIYSTSGFAGVREEALPPEAHARYLLARDSDGTPVAGLEVYSFSTAPHDLYTPGELLGEVISAERTAHLNTRPISIAAGWSEFRGQVPGHVNASAEQRESALSQLGAEALRLAGQAGSSVLAYCYLPLETARELAKAHASDGAVLLLHNVETAMPIGLWADFDDYAAWLPPGRRQRVRRELRRFRESGRVVTELPLPEVVKEIAPLSSALMQKYGHTAYDEERAVATFDRQSRFLGDKSSVLLCKENGKAVGFLLRYRQHDTLYARAAGFDYSVPNADDYYNLMFYHQIAAGVGRSVSSIHLGINTYEAKMRRGAQPTPLYSVFVGVDRPLEAPDSAVRAYNRTHATDFVTRYDKYVVGGINTDDWLLD
ncbi:GNAT family N-acetyltransferase [Streptomyces hygroscopicus]|uniref:GNAT family N-acetyltransferase n=1 Tax=Streptomyces hygroscopicus TaxID=1912 RepID=UPI0004C96CF5|nr:GNAT family N-acetyltransferase [Streptomyces hygroscopicus]